jgi:hypothetical protein
MIGNYGADYNPKKIEKQMRSLVSKEEGYVCLFINLNVVDIKQRTYTYHHQDYMLQFQESSKMQRLTQQDRISQSLASTYALFRCCHQRMYH